MMKYIIFDNYFPVVFTAAISHKEVASGINMKPTSAGSVRFDLIPSNGLIRNEEIKPMCFGKSLTLGDLESLGESDADIIKNMINE